MKLSLCVIGCGGFARTFATAMRSVSGEIELYFASRDLARARSYAAEFGGAGYFGSYAAAANDPRVEALYICTPHHLHLDHSRLAASAGKHVLLEKPIARTVAEGEAIVAAAAAAGVTLMVAENYRFMPPVQRAKEIIASDGIGDVRLAQMQEEFPFKPVEWRNDAELNGGGVFIDGGIHKASMLAYLAGRPTQVYAARVPSAQPGIAAEDGVVVVTRSSLGTVGVINHTWSMATQRPWVSISGSTGNVYFELGVPRLKLTNASGETTLELEGHPDGLAAMALEFRQSIREGRQPAMTGREAMEDLELVLKAYESMRLGAPVTLPAS